MAHCNLIGKFFYRLGFIFIFILYVHQAFGYQSPQFTDTTNTFIDPASGSTHAADTNIVSGDSLDYSGLSDSLVVEDTSFSVKIIDSVNVIQNQEALNVFFSLLARNTGTVSVFHLGDSHVAGKAYPSAVAKYLHSMYGNGKTSIITPKVRARRKAKRRRHAIVRKARVKKQPAKAVKKRSSRPVKKKRPGKSKSFLDSGFIFSQSVAFAGVGIPESFAANNLTDCLPDSQFLYIKDDSTFFSNRVLNYTAFGVSGKSYKYFAESAVTPKKLQETAPNLVIISLGINDLFGKKYDAEYIQNSVEHLLAVIRREVPNASVMFALSGDAFIKKKRSNPFLRSMKEQMQQIAVANNCAYWDPVPVFGGYGYMNAWYKQKLCIKDKVHLTRAGYTLLAAKLTEAIGKAFTSNE
ncbi:MAG: hypothetical protein HYV28_11525 [Ignavibacteriales bacterium]|nr:hypothetical protein [Ignavibacteriales bacterium]